MARIIPKVDLASIINGGERIIATELVRQLPESCLIYHSYPWLHLTRSDYSHKQFLQPGETDFIVVDSEHGLLVLEVKGGTIEYDPTNHLFFRVHDRGGREQIQNPFDQAARNLYAIRDMILGHNTLRGQTSLPFAHGYAVAFPHCVYSGPLPPDAEPEIVFSANDVPDLANKVRGALEIWSRATRARPITESLRDAIQESLSPIFKFTPVLWRTVEDQEEKLKRLTTDQEMVLGILAKQPRAAIEGVAGSGKTILAMGQAQRFARQGKRTLLLCYNRPLADWLDQQLAVLTPTDHGREWPTSFGIIPLTDNFDHWRAGKGVLLSTCRRFKGLEADALVLAGIPKPNTKKYFTNADYYVAASRAKHLLTVVATEAL